MPTVSVIMNCYNGEMYLREAIDSVYAQTFEDWEIIFWDNLSQDGSRNIVASYASDKIKYYEAERHTSLGEARKLALSKAKGEWVAFLDCDDYWYPTKLATQLEHVKDKKYVVCYAGIDEIEPNGKLIRTVLPAYPSGKHLLKQLNQFEVNMVTPIVKRDALEMFSIDFDENIVASEEYNLFIRLAAKGDFCTVNKPLGAWRISAGTLTDRAIGSWANDRFYTLNQLLDENRGNDLESAGEFVRAKARGYYYHARYLFFVNKKKEAAIAIREAGNLFWPYFIFMTIIAFPFGWDFVHSKYIKRKIIPKIFSMASKVGIWLN